MRALHLLATLGQKCAEWGKITPQRLQCSLVTGFRVVCKYFHGAFDSDKEIFDGRRVVEMKGGATVKALV